MVFLAVHSQLLLGFQEVALQLLAPLHIGDDVRTGAELMAILIGFDFGLFLSEEGTLAVAALLPHLELRAKGAGHVPIARFKVGIRLQMGERERYRKHRHHGGGRDERG